MAFDCNFCEDLKWVYIGPPSGAMPCKHCNQDAIDRIRFSNSLNHTAFPYGKEINSTQGNDDPSQRPA